MKQLKLR